MKGNVKQKIFAIILCFVTILISIQFINSNNKNINASDSDIRSYICKPDSVTCYGYDSGSATNGTYTNTSLNSSKYVVASNAIYMDGKYYDLVMYPFKVTGSIRITNSCPSLESGMVAIVYSQDIANSNAGIKLYVTEHGNVNKKVEWYGIFGGNDLDKGEGWAFNSNDFVISHKGKNIVSETFSAASGYTNYYGNCNSDNATKTYVNNYNAIIGAMHIPTTGTIVYHTDKDGGWGSLLCYESLKEYAEENAYIINFDANGGTGAPASIIKYGENTNVVMGDISSTIPKKTGYTFKGWSADNGTHKIAYSNVTTPGATQTASSWTYANYCTNSGGSSSSKTLTLKAQWVATTYNITWNPNGGLIDGNSYPSGVSTSIVYNTATVKQGSTSYTRIPAWAYNGRTARTNYNFLGWYDAASGGNQVFDANGNYKTTGGYWNSSGNWSKTSNVTLYAQWQIKSYPQVVQVRYQNADGSYGAYSNVINANYNHGTTVSWSRSADATYQAASITSYTVTGSKTTQVTVYRNTHTVTCKDYLTDKSTLIGTASGTKTYIYGSTAKGSDWGTTSPYNNTQYTYTYNNCTTTTVNGNTTVYRYWTRAVNPYKQIIQVRFENADGTFTAYQNVINENRNYGTTVSWSRPADATYKAASITNYTVTEAKTTQVTVYRNTYTVTLNKGTGIASVTQSGNGTYRAGSSVTISATASTGYTWSKWTGTHNINTSSYTFTITQNVEDTANATINPYILTVNPNNGIWDGKTTNSTFTLNYNTTKTIANPTREGYNFKSWTINGAGSTISGTTFKMGYANTTITAQWEARTDTAYKVNHHLMNLDGTTYKCALTETLEGTTDKNVTPTVKTYEGFTSPATQTVKIKADGTTVVDYYYIRNKYPVTYIDVVNDKNGTVLKTYDKENIYFGTTATGAIKGVDTADNKYHNGYYYSSCTTETVTTNGATVYRIFKLRTIDINGSVNWNDKSNAYNSRPASTTITLFKNGIKIDTITGLTSKDNNTFSFTNLQKYDTTTGEAYKYTVSQNAVTSLNNPEDKYTSTQNENNFTNTLENTSKENPEPEWIGFEVSGSIIWDDYDDKFGTRPNEIVVNLYQNGKLHKTQVINKNITGYSFVNLDKYDENLVPYTYQVEEVFTAKALTWDSITKVLKEIDAYTIDVEGFDFINTLVETEDQPIIEVKPEYINSLTIKLDFYKNIDWTEIEKTSSEVTSFITLKQMETLINNGKVSYTSNYNGMEYNAIVNELGITINNIPSGKYEIVESNDNTFILEGIDLQTTNSLSVVNENNKWYLIIAETDQHQSGTIILNMNTDSFNGYDSVYNLKGLYKTNNTSTAQIMMMSMFSDEVTVPEYVEPITYTITYKDCDIVDDTKYSESSEAILKDCEIEGFLGWSENSEAIKPQYLAGDKINLEKYLILYPVIETSEQSSEETTEEKTSETENLSEIEKSEENNDSVESSEELSNNYE